MAQTRLCHAAAFILDARHFQGNFPFLLVSLIHSGTELRTSQSVFTCLIVFNYRQSNEIGFSFPILLSQGGRAFAGVEGGSVICPKSQSRQAVVMLTGVQIPLLSLPPHHKPSQLKILLSRS